MNWADYAILSILIVSSLISLKRGFVKEALSMLNWGAAILIAIVFRDSAATLLEPHIDVYSIRNLVAFAGLFITTLIVGSLVNNLISEFIKMTGLSGTDRLLGMVFGALRGFAVIMALLLLVAPTIGFDKDAWWAESLLIPYFLEFESGVRGITQDIYNFFSGFLNQES